MRLLGVLVAFVIAIVGFSGPSFAAPFSNAGNIGIAVPQGLKGSDVIKVQEDDEDDEDDEDNGGDGDDGPGRPQTCIEGPIGTICF